MVYVYLRSYCCARKVALLVSHAKTFLQYAVVVFCKKAICF
jgi:hypothetical protein